MPVRDLLSAASGASSAGPADPYFYDVSLLLNGDGTNGAQNNTFLDGSTNNFTITRNGNTTQGSFSPYGDLWSNYLTTGGTDYLTVASNAAFCPGTGQFSIEFWYNKTAYGGNEGVMINTEATGGLIITEAGGGVALSQRSTGNNLQSSTTLTVGTWNHIVVCRNNSNVTSIFVNGTRVVTGTVTANFATGALYVGNLPVSGYWATGYYSNLRVVKGSTVYDPSQSTITVPTTPLTAVSGTQLLTAQSNRFVDNSSNAFAITVNGTPSVQRFSPFNPTSTYSTSVIGGSGYFNGSGDYLTVANNAAFQFGASNWAVQFWIYFTNAGGVQVINNFGYGSPNTNRSWLIYINSGDFRVAQSTDGSTSYDTSLGLSTPVANTWYQLTVSRSGGTVQGFLNGVAGTALTAYNLYAYTGSLYISTQDGTNYPVSGYISDYRILKGTGYTSVTVPTAPLTAITNTSLLLSYTNAGIPDLAMMNNLETVGNAQVSTSVKKYGTGSLYFPAKTDYLQEPSNQTYAFGTGNFTIEFWVYMTTTSSANFFFQISDTVGGFKASTTNTICFYSNPGASDSGMTLIAGNTSTQGSGGFPVVNTWYHFAIVRNGTTTTLYKDGTSYLSLTDSANYTTPYIVIGNGYQTSRNGVTGYIDDFRITSGLARYTTTFTPPTAALPTY